MKASADELQAIIDEAWKILNSKKHQSTNSIKRPPTFSVF